MHILNINNWEQLLIGSVLGMVVVFVALTVLVIVFEWIQKMAIYIAKKKMAKSGQTMNGKGEASANEIAAISLALHLYSNDFHDQESNVITIRRIERRYSPWSSKIYGLNNRIHKI